MALPRKILIILGLTLVTLGRTHCLRVKASSILKVNAVRNIYPASPVSLGYFLILLLLIALILSLVIGWLLKKRLLQKLTYLKKDISRIATSSHLSERVSVTGKDEVSDLADEINQMLIAQEGSEKARHPDDELEMKVQERTKSLSQANETLRTEATEGQAVRQKLQVTLDKLRSALGGTIQAMALTVEIRDAYTAGHHRRVADLARAIATEMHLSEHQIDGIRMAGAIHDVGKIAVPVEILNKPTPITDIEINLVKIHPLIGYDILKSIEFPWPIDQIVLQHHERMDGSGYPHGLSNGRIMLEARILAVADVIEAMTSHRPHRPALDIHEALEELSKNKGILYDADVVDACVKLFTEKGFKFR